jgi:hypothetical protein
VVAPGPLRTAALVFFVGLLIVFIGEKQLLEHRMHDDLHEPAPGLRAHEDRLRLGPLLIAALFRSPFTKARLTLWP